MPIYNKLVRDNIPQVIEKNNKQFSTRVLSKEEYVVEVKKKMKEELEEYQEAPTNEKALEELADILELMHAAIKIHGGFEKRIFLIEVEGTKVK